MTLLKSRNRAGGFVPLMSKKQRSVRKLKGADDRVRATCVPGAGPVSKAWSLSAGCAGWESVSLFCVTLTTNVVGRGVK